MTHMVKIDMCIPVDSHRNTNSFIRLELMLKKEIDRYFQLYLMYILLK